MSTSNLAFAPPPARVSPRNASTPLPASGSPTACECARTFNLICEQGATLSSQITITLEGAPVDLTGATFEFTAKTDPTLPDDDPGVIMVDWQETSAPTSGATWLIVDADTTAGMQVVGYSYQTRMVSSGGVVTPLFKGVLTITQPISSRH